ncbi:MAG: glyoxalase [Elusimicrobia bacterium RIFOXYD12_FULL_66_9]|nr:MAG: glyoxalase [Elusimicrobia bacterium RIFOXYD12_FULL_66_9]
MSLPPETLGIRHVALRVADVQRSEAFYCGVLGYRVEWRPDADDVYLTLDGQDNLALHKGAVPPGETRLDHFGVMLKKAEDVDAWHEHLKAAGTPILKEPKTHRDGARSFYAADPDGNVIQLIHMRRP